MPSNIQLGVINGPEVAPTQKPVEKTPLEASLQSEQSFGKIIAACGVVVLIASIFVPYAFHGNAWTSDGAIVAHIVLGTVGVAMTALGAWKATKSREQWQQEMNAAFHEAMDEGNIEEITKYLNRGAEVNSKNNHLCGTALNWAIKRNKPLIVNLLLSRDAKFDGQTAHSALQSPKIFIQLLDPKYLTHPGRADFVPTIHHYNAAFHEAMDNRDIKEITRFLNLGANVNSFNNHRCQKALNWAIGNDQKEIVDLLLSRDARFDDNTARIAIQHPKILTQLLDPKYLTHPDRAILVNDAFFYATRTLNNSYRDIYFNSDERNDLVSAIRQLLPHLPPNTIKPAIAGSSLDDFLKGYEPLTPVEGHPERDYSAWWAEPNYEPSDRAFEYWSALDASQY